MTPTRLFKIEALVLAAALVGANAAQAGSDQRVYIPTGDNAEVAIIDADTSSVTGLIADLPAAHGLALTPDGSRLIAGSLAGRAPGMAMAEKPAGVSAEDHAAHHAKKSPGDAQPMMSMVSIIDTATNSVVRRIGVPGAVHHVAVSPDGRVAAVTHPKTGAITMIDLDALEVIKTVPTGEVPNYAVFSRDGAKLYVSNAGEGTIAVLDSSTWAVTGKIPVGKKPEHIALAPDGATLYVNNTAGGSVSVIDLAAGKVVDTLAIGTNLHGIDVSDDGATLFVAVRGEDKLVAIGLKDGSRRDVALSPAPYHLNVIRGTGTLYVSSRKQPIVWVIDTATLETKAKFDLPGIGHQFAQVPGS